MKVEVVFFNNGALGTVPKRLAKWNGELEFYGRIEANQTTALLQ